VDELRTIELFPRLPLASTETETPMLGAYLANLWKGSNFLISRDLGGTEIVSAMVSNRGLHYHVPNRPFGGMVMRVVLCLLLVCTSFSVAQTSHKPSAADKSMLIALENAWNQAQLQHDSKALDALVADSFVSTDNDGVFENKAQFLADNRDRAYVPSLMANSNETVMLYGTTAIVAGIYHAKGSLSGKPFDHRGRFTDTWVNLDGTWKCVATHTSPLRK
jgi:ketosteroid isomerase-like protein